MKMKRLIVAGVSITLSLGLSLQAKEKSSSPQMKFQEKLEQVDSSKSIKRRSNSKENTVNQEGVGRRFQIQPAELPAKLPPSEPDRFEPGRMGVEADANQFCFHHNRRDGIYSPLTTRDVRIECINPAEQIVASHGEDYQNLERNITHASRWGHQSINNRLECYALFYNSDRVGPAQAVTILGPMSLTDSHALLKLIQSPDNYENYDLCGGRNAATGHGLKQISHDYMRIAFSGRHNGYSPNPRHERFRQGTIEGQQVCYTSRFNHENGTIISIPPLGEATFSASCSNHREGVARALPDAPNYLQNLIREASDNLLCDVHVTHVLEGDQTIRLGQMSLSDAVHLLESIKNQDHYHLCANQSTGIDPEQGQDEMNYQLDAIRLR